MKKKLVLLIISIILAGMTIANSIPKNTKNSQNENGDQQISNLFIRLNKKAIMIRN